ncbi:MAG: domain containing protein [Marmoricola sp.]|nr:domain containing protein [Marmoricola sp.]
MSASGYAQSANNTKMFWRMYTGHNCTNYAAYRMVKSGLANTRPWTGGSGNASYWGVGMSSITNATPAVGAVAWWKANVPGAGSAGHVAYVEQVISATEVVVSQDSWGGDFAWTRLVKGSSGWPSGFIHFNDVPLTNTALPAVTGTAKVGSVLTSSSGTWTPSAPTIKYQWLAGGVAISGATSSTLTLQLAQQDKPITVRVTASKTGYPTRAVTSAATTAVEPGSITNSAPPAISGTPKVDSTLEVSSGQWKPTPATVTYQWTANGAPIPGAKAATLTADPSLVGKALAVTVTAAKTGYTPVAVTSKPTTSIAAGTFAATPSTITGTPRTGQTLTLHRGRVTPAGGAVAVQWLRGGVAVPGASGSTYQLTAADLGSRIGARLTVTRAGYTTLTSRTPVTWAIKSVPRLKVLTTPGHRRVRFTVTLTASGVSPVSGTVQVRSRGKLLKVLTLRKGTATATITRLAKGSRTFTIRYLASPTVLAAALTRSVRIR